ncbi:MAG: ATP-binding protein [Nitrospirae bacterium]|nr:ATP-binding protein [Nitrospirota bacterium]MCL5978455.1 ATP-binding protein [Nitrospirota bacterium]
MHARKAIGEEKLMPLFANHQQGIKETVEGKEMWEQTFNAITDPVMILDTDLRIIRVNKSMAERLGVASHEVEGLACYKVLHGKNESIPYSRLLADGRSRSAEIYEERMGGYFLITMSPLVTSDGVIYGFVHHAHDITERKLAEKAIWESENRYKRLVGSITDYIYTIQVENGGPVKTTHGPGCMGVTGYSTEDYDADPYLWYRMIYDEDRESVMKYIEKALSGEIKLSFCHRIIHRDGRIIWIENTIVPRFGEEHRIVAYDGLIKDITESKHAEEEKRKLQEQLLQSQKMEAIGTLSGGIAHEFKNFLTVIHGFADIILKGKSLSPDSIKYIGIIEDFAKRASQIVSRLLSFARKSEFKPIQLNINSTIENTLDIVSKLFSPKFSIKKNLKDSLPPIIGDAVLIEQVLMNLIVNARDAMPAGGEISVETDVADIESCNLNIPADKVSGDYVNISISDTGIGIPKEHLDCIFEPFYTTKEAEKGTGLGLAIVYGIVRQHNGFIDVCSEPGAGTTFKIYLPLMSSQR